MKVETYLFFDGRTEEALEFYRTAVGATDIQIMRNKESPEPPPPGALPPGSENKVMHSRFRVGDTVVMASDGRCQGKAQFAGFGLAITVTSEADAQRIFDALAQGGQVQMPLTKTFFSPRFGMVHDRFGVLWMVIVEHEGAHA